MIEHRCIFSVLSRKEAESNDEMLESPRKLSKENVENIQILKYGYAAIYAFVY